VRERWIQGYVELPGLENSQDRCNDESPRFKEKRNGFFTFPEMRQDGASETIGNLIELCVGKLQPSGHHRKTVGISSRLLLEAGGNGLLYLRVFKGNKCVCGTPVCIHIMI
jgi:hypothetical protein